MQLALQSIEWEAQYNMKTRNHTSNLSVCHRRNKRPQNMQKTMNQAAFGSGTTCWCTSSFRHTAEFASSSSLRFSQFASEGSFGFNFLRRPKSRLPFSSGMRKGSRLSPDDSRTRKVTSAMICDTGYSRNDPVWLAWVDFEGTT